jgi:hypothetical protein
MPYCKKSSSRHLHCSSVISPPVALSRRTDSKKAIGKARASTIILAFSIATALLPVAPLHGAGRKQAVGIATACRCRAGWRDPTASADVGRGSGGVPCRRHRNVMSPGALAPPRPLKACLGVRSTVVRRMSPPVERFVDRSHARVERGGSFRRSHLFPPWIGSTVSRLPVSRGN